jgi:hypothetical protein
MVLILILQLPEKMVNSNIFSESKNIFITLRRKKFEWNMSYKRAKKQKYDP